MPKKALAKKKKSPKKHVPLAAKNVATTEHRVASALRLLRQSLAMLWAHKKLFAGVLSVVAFVQLLVVEGIVRTDFVAMNQDLRDLVGSGALGLGSGLLSYAYLLGSSGQSGATGFVQSLLTILGTLALLWACREASAGNHPRIRDAFYKSTYPLVPFVLVTLWLGIQLLPALFGAWMYSVVMTNGIAVHLYEQLIWLFVFIGLSAISLRFVIGSLFALIITTLPDVTPVLAIRSAKNLVQGRRLMILRKLVIVSITLLLAITAIILPTILVAPAAVPVLFYAVGLLSQAIFIAWIYSLYKELLQ